MSTTLQSLPALSRHRFLGHPGVPIGGHLPEHGHGVEEDLDILQLQLIIYLSHHDALNINHAAVRLDRDLFPLAAAVLARLSNKRKRKKEKGKKRKEEQKERTKMRTERNNKKEGQQRGQNKN